MKNSRDPIMSNVKSILERANRYDLIRESLDRFDQFKILIRMQFGIEPDSLDHIRNGDEIYAAAIEKVFDEWDRLIDDEKKRFDLSRQVAELQMECDKLKKENRKLKRNINNFIKQSSSKAIDILCVARDCAFDARFIEDMIRNFEISNTKEDNDE